jgi:outer membrane protein OmpA-like peptidoglycan-associated protein
VKESQIQTIGLGETQPIESNFNEMGRAKNRRIEIKISN